MFITVDINAHNGEQNNLYLSSKGTTLEINHFSGDLIVVL